MTSDYRDSVAGGHRPHSSGKRWLRRQAGVARGFPSQQSSQFDSGDHPHPSDLGYKATGDGIDVGLFP